MFMLLKQSPGIFPSCDFQGHDQQWYPRKTSKRGCLQHQGSEFVLQRKQMKKKIHTKKTFIT